MNKKMSGLVKKFAITSSLAASLGVSGCASTRQFEPTTCDDTTIITSLLTGEEVARNKHEFSRACLAGLISTSIVRAAEKSSDPVQREQLLSVAAAAYRKNPEMRAYIEMQLKAHGLSVDLAGRNPDTLYARNPTDKRDVVKYSIKSM